jgi:hypothetical protein
VGAALSADVDAPTERCHLMPSAGHGKAQGQAGRPVPCPGTPKNALDTVSASE